MLFRSPALKDNYVIVLHGGGQAAVVDPAEAEPVAAWLEAQGLDLVAVLQTHHHSDHIGGTPMLLRRWPGAAVVAAAADRQRIPFQTHSVGDGASFTLLGRLVSVLAVPGHTQAHIVFHLPALVLPEESQSPSAEPQVPHWDGQAYEVPVAPGWGELFCGDTLFLAGCEIGRAHV